jgi:hypothetical protein
MLRQTFALTFRGENITQDDVPSDLMDTPGSSYTVQNVQTGAIVLTIPQAGNLPYPFEYFRQLLTDAQLLYIFETY